MSTSVPVILLLLEAKVLVSKLFIKTYFVSKRFQMWVIGKGQK